MGSFEEIVAGVASRVRRTAVRAAAWMARRQRPSLPGPFARVTHPWGWRGPFEASAGARFCNICCWQGDSFLGFEHSEGAVCPDCGSIARDRFLFFCFVGRRPRARYRVLETSPRLGQDYRRAMRGWFDYRASDFDLRGHRADIALDLQDIHLEPGSVDVLLTPHVLEHVPDTDRALAGIHRLLAPGGVMYLQVPVLQGRTARPATPEFHGDDTPVEWRFGPDLTERLRGHGFEARLLCTRELLHQVEAGGGGWPGPVSPEFDVRSILECLCYSDLLAVAGDDEVRRMGFRPAYMFLTWECTKRG